MKLKPWKGGVPHAVEGCWPAAPRQPTPRFRFIHEATATRDPDGTEVVRIRLRNQARRCVVPKAVHDRLTAVLGDRVSWWVSNAGSPHVMVKSREGGETIHVARFILGLGSRARVHYADDSALNLREGNVRPGLSPTTRAKPCPAFRHDLVHHHRKGIEYVVMVGLEAEETTGKRRRATIDKSAYDHLTNCCGVTPWRIEGKGKARQVVFETACPGIVQSVAEFVAGGPKDAPVTHLDGNFLNLRASNLAVGDDHSDASAG